MHQDMRLSAFEEYMYRDDRPDYPMTGVVRLRFSEKLDVEAVSSSLAKAFGRHPLLRSKIRRSSWGRLYWTDDSQFNPVPQQVVNLNSDEYPPVEYIDLTTSAGTRVWLIDRGMAHELVLQMHHACTDAIGVCRFLEDLVCAYAAHGPKEDASTAVSPVPSGDQIPFARLDESRLSRRWTFGRSFRQILQRVPGLRFGIPNVWVFFRRRPVCLGRSEVASKSPSLPPDAPTILRHRFDAPMTGRILALAKSQNVTVNDLLARDLFLAVGRWRQLNESPDASSWIRLAVPVNLRTPADTATSAANLISLQFLHGRASEFDDPDRMLAAIHQDMNRVKEHELGLLFVGALMLARSLPGGLGRMVPGDQCLSTCVLTNIGVVFRSALSQDRSTRLRFGDAVVEQIDFIPPLRPNTHAAFCIYSYAGQLTMTLNYDSRFISAAQAEVLLKHYTEAIDDSVFDGKSIRLPMPSSSLRAAA